jgi:hypothetical protein
MRNKILIPLLSLLLLALAGCVAPWLPGGTPYTTKKGEFTVRTPAGWIFSEQSPGRVFATKDGLILQQFTVELRALKDALPASKRVLTAGLTPLEVAEAVTDDLRADHSLLGLAVKETTLARLDGREGFKIVISFHTQDKLHLSQTIYGCLGQERLCLLRFTAPSRHYFDRDHPAFEETVASFRFGKS